MLNIDNFVKRVEILLDYYSLNASTFADKIGIQRSSMSHLLSGRNKPSLDFILKITDAFPEIDLYWILMGKGSFPASNAIHTFETGNDLNVNVNDLKVDISTSSIKDPQLNLFSEIKSPVATPFVETSKNETSEQADEIISDKSDRLDKIVFFYTNGTFKVYSEK